MLLVTSLGVIANDAIVIKGKAPRGIEVLSTFIASHKEMPENKGSHGLSEFCYKANAYVVYSINLLGHGYQLSKVAPNGLECSKSNIVIKSENKLGMHVGMLKQEVENLVGLSGLKEKQTIIWQSKISINNRNFDLQTHLDVLFKKGKLEWISVFTTTTS